MELSTRGTLLLTCHQVTVAWQSTMGWCPSEGSRVLLECKVQWRHGYILVPRNPAGPQMTERNTPRAIRSLRQSCHSTQLFFLHRLKRGVESLFLWGRESDEIEQ